MSADTEALTNIDVKFIEELPRKFTLTSYMTSLGSFLTPETTNLQNYSVFPLHHFAYLKNLFINLFTSVIFALDGPFHL